MHLAYFLCGDFRFFLTLPSASGEPGLWDIGVDPEDDVSWDMEFVATCMPFLGGRPIRFPDALILGSFPSGGLK